MFDETSIVFEGKKRFYKEDLTCRDYSLENTTPHKMYIFEYVLEENAWVEMIRSVASLLISIYGYDKEQLLSFRCGWSKAAMFTSEKKTNHKLIDEGLYVNCNHTALHACWFIQDMLDYFNVNKADVTLLIHRPSAAENKEIKEYLSKKAKHEFEEFLVCAYDKDREYSNKVVANIEKYLNPLLRKISKSHIDLFLFDDSAVLYNYIKKIREIIEWKLDVDEKVKRALYKYLDYLVAFYKV